MKEKYKIQLFYILNGKNGDYGAVAHAYKM